MKTRHRKQSAFSIRNPLRKPTLRKTRGKARCGGEKAQSRRRRIMRIAGNDDNRSEYQESATDQQEDTVGDAMRRLLKAECATYRRGIGGD